MIDYSINEIALNQVLTYILIGVICAFVFFIFSRYLLPLISRGRQSWLRVWSKAEIVFWLVYVALLYTILFRTNMLVTIAMSIVIFGAGWNYWRNVFSGLIIKLDSQLKQGDAIDIEFAKGELKSIGLSQSELMNESGEMIVVPNYTLRNSVLRHLNKETNVQTQIFKVTTKQDMSSESVYRLALECPFISSNQKIEVERVNPDEVIVRAAVIDNAYIDNVHRYFQASCN